MDFNVTQCKKFTDVVSDSTVQLNLKKIPLAQFWYSTEGKYSQLSEEAIKIFPPYPTLHMCKVKFA